MELFVNGASQGIQILPPFLYDITEAVQDGENDIRIEVATTLERERGANKGKQAPIGIYSAVKVYKVNIDDNPLHSDPVIFLNTAEK